MCKETDECDPDRKKADNRNCFWKSLDGGLGRPKQLLWTKENHALLIKKGMMTMSHQMENIREEVEVIKKNQIKFWS